MNRGKSVFGSSFYKKQSLLEDEISERKYTEILQNLKSRPGKLRQLIGQYRKATTQQQQHKVYGQFRKQQVCYKRFREQLKEQLHQVKNEKTPQDSQYNYLRNQLVHFVKQQMNLDLEMNQLIQIKKSQRQAQKLKWQKLEGKTPRVHNALQDIIQKTNQILQLQNSIKQCLDILQIIGILVKQQGDKIQIVEDQVKFANQCIEQAEKQIDIAKIRMEKATRKKCCVIIIGLVLIVLILVILYGISLYNL